MLRRWYDWMIGKAAHRHAPAWLFLFAFVEASFFPIPPHPLFGLMCLAEPKKALRYAAVATLGSVAGGMLGYAIGALLYDAIGQELIAWLGLTRSFPVAACYLREYGPEIILLKGATPIPFKLLTITAGFIHMSLVPFVLASLASRSISFMVVGVLFQLFGEPIKRFIDRYLGWVTLGFVALVVAGFLMITLIGGEGSATSDKCATETVKTV